MALGSEGSVRGAFDLDTGPAIRGVREYRQEAARADAQTRQLGGSIDDAFGANQVASIEAVSTSTRDLADDTRKARIEVRDQWKGMRREIQREAAAITSTIAVVRDRMRSLGDERVTPQIDLTGIDRAIAQVEVLRQRLDSLGRQRATPRVAMGGGFGGAAGRARAGASAAAGGGGGGSGILSLGGVGFAGIKGRTLLGAGAVGLPAVSSLLGGATGIGSSAVMGATGLGAVGLTGITGLVAGVASIAAVAKPAAAGIKEASDAQTKWVEAIREHGRRSEEARKAQEGYNRALAHAPAFTRELLREFRGLTRDWDRATRPGQANLVGLGAGAIQQFREGGGLRAASRAGNRATASLQREGTALVAFSGTNAFSRGTRTGTAIFDENLRNLRVTAQNVYETVTNISEASRPFLREATDFMREWTGGWAKSTRDIGETRDEIGDMVDDAKVWMRTFRDGYRLLRDIAELSAPEGTSLVSQLDETFVRWDDWIKGHPQETRAWFRDSANSVREMASALKDTVHWLSDMANLLRPLLDRFSQLVSLASSLGVLGAPGAFAAVVGGYRGARGGMGGGTAAMAMGGGGGGGMGGGGAGSSALAAGGAYYLASRGRGRFGPIATPEGFSQRYGGVAGARYGMPASQLGARTPMFGRGLNMAGGALRGAGRAFWPLALGMGALDAASFDGGAGEKLQAGVSSASLGLLAPMPKTNAQVTDAAGGYVQQFMQDRLGQLPNTVAGGRTGLNTISGEISRLQGQRGLTAGDKRWGGNDASIFGLVDTPHGNRLTDEQMKENKKRIELLVKERDALARSNQELAKHQEMDRKRQRRTAARADAEDYATKLPDTYNVFAKGGLGPEAAMDRTIDGVKSKLKKMKTAGVETLGEASLAWANEMAKNNPALKKEVDELNDAIERRFRRMGKHVEIVNGDILTGSKTEWRQIRDAMKDPIEEARQKMDADFTAIQRKAVGSLISMGFGRAAATNLVKGMEAGGERGSKAAADARAGHPTSLVDPIGTAAHPTGKKKATGGMIGGNGLLDTVPMGDGMAAPGEAWIANRHTLADISRATVDKYGKTAKQMITGESRRHSQRPTPQAGIMPGYATGGRTRMPSLGLLGEQTAGALNSTPGATGSLDAMVQRANAIDSQHYPYRWGGGHDPGFTPPYDCSGAVSSVLHAGGALGSPLTSGAFMSWGEKGPGDVTLYANAGHVYMSLLDQYFGTSTSNPQGGAGWFAGGPRAGFVQRHISASGGGALRAGSAGGAALAGVGAALSLSGVGQKQPGVPGALRERAGDIFAKGLEQKVNEKIAASSAGAAGFGLGTAMFGAGGGGAGNKGIAQQMLGGYGWGSDQWAALDWLWTKESGWNERARNPSSGAFGIPQALPASKMASAGPDWATNAATQIAWGLGYIRDRYGSPSAAATFHRGHNWYSRGGLVDWGGMFEAGGSMVTNGPTAFVAGDGRSRRERVTVTPEKAGRPAGGGGPIQITVEAGAVQVIIGADALAGAGGDIEALAEKVGAAIVPKITEAIRKGATKAVIG